MKSLRVKLAVGVAVLGVAGVGTAAIAHDRSRFDASLTGYEEVPTLSTQGGGTFKASINRGKDEIRYTLSYHGPFDAGRAGPSRRPTSTSARGPSTAASPRSCARTSATARRGRRRARPTGTVSGTITPAQVSGRRPRASRPASSPSSCARCAPGRPTPTCTRRRSPRGEIRGQIGSDDDDHHGRD